MSQAASHEPKGKVIADVQAGEWESSHLSVERQVSVENMKNEVLPALSSAWIWGEIPGKAVNPGIILLKFLYGIEP